MADDFVEVAVGGVLGICFYILVGAPLLAGATWVVVSVVQAMTGS